MEGGAVYRGEPKTDEAPCAALLLAIECTRFSGSGGRSYAVCGKTEEAPCAALDAY